MIGDNIRTLRELNNMSRREFGEALYVSQDVINNLERNRVAPTELMIKCICDTFQVNRVWLETGEGDMFALGAEQAETARMVESISDSPAMRSLLATWAQLSDENKAVFEEYAREYVADYNQRLAEEKIAQAESLMDEAAAEPDVEQKNA